MESPRSFAKFEGNLFHHDSIRVRFLLILLYSSLFLGIFSTFGFNANSRRKKPFYGPLSCKMFVCQAFRQVITPHLRPRQLSLWWPPLKKKKKMRYAIWCRLWIIALSEGWKPIYPIHVAQGRDKHHHHHRHHVRSLFTYLRNRFFCGRLRKNIFLCSHPFRLVFKKTINHAQI